MTTKSDKPKRKGNSTTRHGSGAGYGGPAKGPGAGGKRHPSFGPGTNAQGHGKTTPAPFNRAELRRQRQDEVESHMFHLALNAVEQRDQISAGKAFMIERKEISGSDGAPLHVVYSWADEPKQE